MAEVFIGLTERQALSMFQTGGSGLLVGSAIAVTAWGRVGRPLPGVFKATAPGQAAAITREPQSTLESTFKHVLRHGNQAV